MRACQHVQPTCLAVPACLPPCVLRFELGPAAVHAVAADLGPLYQFPLNAYSDNANASMIFAEIAQANAMVAQAERLLWTARRPTAKVAILYPRSSALCLPRSMSLWFSPLIFTVI